MIINKNWNRWIFASMAAYMKPLVVDTLPFVAEGQNRKENADLIELRMTGPRWQQFSAVEYRGDIMFNALVRAIKDEHDFHKIRRFTGLVEASFIICIPVRKYGDGPDDDPTVVIGQLMREIDVHTQHYGQLDSDIPMFESTVEAQYRIDF